MLRASLRPLAIVALGLLFFADLVAHPGRVLYSDSSDLVALHVAPARFLTGSWQATGELPLWCPYNFAGTPFVHDLQVAAFYPMAIPLYLLPGRSIAVALSWLVVAHVIIAGWCMYAYSRDQALGPTAAMVAAFGYMFGGKWMVHLLVAGHYMVVGLAWLPLVLLLLERAIRRRSVGYASMAGAAFAMVVLGTHPQWTLYAGLLLASWTLGPALEEAGTWREDRDRSWRGIGVALGSWLAIGTWCATVAFALCAVQLLPGLEAATQATRGLTGMVSRDGVESLLSLVEVVGPSLSGPTRFYDWEFRGGMGVLWIVAAMLAPALCPGRVRFQACVCSLLVAYAFGGGILLDRLPGFRLFPMHVRMMLIVALPVASLAGSTTQSMLTDSASAPIVRRLGHRLLLWVSLLALASYGFLALAVGVRNLPLQAYWIALLVTVPTASWLFLHGPKARGDNDRGLPRLTFELAWGGILLIDLWAMSWPYVQVRPVDEVFEIPQCVRFLAAHRQGNGRVLDRTLPDDPTKTPLGAASSISEHIEQVRGYNPLNILRFVEYLHFIADRDPPARPIRMIANFPIKNKTLLDLLGVRYLLQPTDPALVPEADSPTDGDPRWRKVDEDARPRTFILFEGLQELPSYSVYENRQVFPRAFIVPEAAPLPDRPRVLEALKANDFRRRVLLEGLDPVRGSRATAGGFRPAEIREYLPNRVTVGLDGGPPGYLVLTDVWFPGWTCEVDGKPARLFRGNFLFRAVELPAGARGVVFTFSPASYRWGKVISLMALAMVTGLCLAALRRRAMRRATVVVERSRDGLATASC